MSEVTLPTTSEISSRGNRLGKGLGVCVQAGGVNKGSLFM